MKIKLRQSAHPFFQASTRPSTYRVQEAPPTEGASEIPILSINSQTILFGDGGVSQSLVRCIRLIKGTPEKKAVFEVEWQGTKAIAKCWSPEAYERCVNHPSILSLSITPSLTYSPLFAFLFDLRR